MHVVPFVPIYNAALQSCMLVLNVDCSLIITLNLRSHTSICGNGLVIENAMVVLAVN
jgi:hypothetical protein